MNTDEISNAILRVSPLTPYGSLAYKLGFATVILTTILLFNQPLVAQPVPSKLPDSVHLFPAGGQRGSTVNVHIGVEQAPPHTGFFIRGRGVHGDGELTEEIFNVGQPSPRRPPTEIPISYPRQFSGKIDLANDAALGVAYWDISCAAGGSTGSLPFIVGDLPEFIESESNSTAKDAESVQIPATVNGQIHGERDLDYFAFKLDAGQVVYCEVIARRIGSRLEPALAILDSSGKRLKWQKDFIGDDPLLAFKAPASGTYLLQIGNVSFHGSPSHVYRINLTHRAPVASVFPIGAPANIPTKFTFSAMSGDPAHPVQTWHRELVLPKNQTASDQFYHHHYQDELLSQPIPLGVLGSAAQIVPEANRSSVRDLKIGQIVNGRFQLGQTDVFSLHIDDPAPLDVRVVSPADCRGASIIDFQIFDEQGKSVYRSPITPAVDEVKVQYFWKNPSKGSYKLHVACLDGAEPVGGFGGYQLQIVPPQTDFSLLAGSDCLSVTQDSALEIPVSVQRRGGFAGPIELALFPLPEGVAIENNVVPMDKNETKLKVIASKKAPSRRYELNLVGIAKMNDGEMRHPVRLRHRGHDSNLIGIDSPLRETLVLTIRHKPIFRLTCEEAYQYARRGTVYPYLMTIERLDGFNEPIIVQRADRQNRDMDGIDFIETRVEPGVSQLMMPIFLPETMHINIQGQSQLYTQAYASFVDAQGVRQHFIAVSEKRNMLRTMPTVAKMSPQQPVLSIHRNAGPNTIGLRLDRTSNMTNPMRVSLGRVTAPDGTVVTERWQMQSDAFQKNETTCIAKIILPPDTLPGRYQLEFRAEGSLDDKPEQMAVTCTTINADVQ